MPTTPSLALPYPAPMATPDVPYDLQQLAQAVENAIANAPRVGLTISANQSIAVSGTLQAISWDVEGSPADVNAMHSAGSPTRLTATKAGLYLLAGGVEFLSNATGFRRLQWRFGGATFGAAINNTPITGVNTHMTVTQLWQAALNDYAELMATQTSGGALNIITGGTTFAQAIWLCP